MIGTQVILKLEKYTDSPFLSMPSYSRSVQNSRIPGIQKKKRENDLRLETLIPLALHLTSQPPPSPTASHPKTDITLVLDLTLHISLNQRMGKASWSETVASWDLQTYYNSTPVLGELVTCQETEEDNDEVDIFIFRNNVGEKQSQDEVRGAGSDQG